MITNLGIMSDFLKEEDERRQKMDKIFNQDLSKQLGVLDPKVGELSPLYEVIHNLNWVNS